MRSGRRQKPLANIFEATHRDYFSGFLDAVAILYWQGRAPGAVAGFAVIDFVFGALFVAAYRRSGW